METIDIPHISTPLQVIPFKALQTFPTKTDKWAIVDGDLNTPGIQLRSGVTELEISFDSPVQFVDLTMLSNSDNAKLSIKGLGIDEENILKKFPKGEKQTYRLLTELNATGSLKFRYEGAAGEVSFYNLSGYVITEQDPDSLVLVKASQAKVRKGALDPTTDYPALIDGDLGDTGIMMSDKSYQFVQIFYNKPIKFLEITANNTGRKRPINLNFKGSVVTPDIVKDFPDGKKTTVRYRLKPGTGIVTLFTGQDEGVFTFYEISAYADKQ